MKIDQMIKMLETVKGQAKKDNEILKAVITTLMLEKEKRLTAVYNSLAKRQEKRKV